MYLEKPFTLRAFGLAKTDARVLKDMDDKMAVLVSVKRDSREVIED